MIMITSMSPINLLRNNLLINAIGWTILLPSLPVIYAHFGANTASIGVLVSFVAMITFVCGALQGFASDYLGRLVMLKICAVAQLCGHLLTIYSLYTYSFPLFVVARCLPAVFKCCMVVSQAFLFDIESRQEPGTVSALGSLYACCNIAFIIGPLVGGFCIARSLYHASAVGCVLSMVEMGMLMLMKELPKKEKENTTHESYSSSPTPQSKSSASTIRTVVSCLALLPPRLVELLHIKFAFQLCNCLFEAMFPQYGRTQFGLTGYATGVLFSLSGALSALTNVYLLQWALASSPRAEIYMSLYLVATGLGLYVWALWSSLNGLIVAMVVITISSNLFQGVLQNTIMKCMKELRERESESNNNLDGCATNSNSEDIEGGYMVEESASKIATQCNDRMEAGSPSSVAQLQLRVNPRRHNHNNIPQHTQHNCHHNQSSPKDTKSSNAGAGAVFGMSASADRAARVVSPMLGGVLIQHFNTAGLVVLVTASVSYGLALLLYSQSIPCIAVGGMLQDGMTYCTDCVLHVSSVVDKTLSSVHVKRGIDTDMLYYGGERSKHEKYL